jgi:transposase InsO family protein
LRAEHTGHVWSYDFVEDKTTDGRKIRFLNIIDEYSHECIASVAARTWRGPAVAEALAEAFTLYRCPEYLRSDNGPEFIAIHLRR